jgi:hypothetical protein
MCSLAADIENQHLLRVCMEEDLHNPRRTRMRRLQLSASDPSVHVGVTNLHTWHFENPVVTGYGCLLSREPLVLADCFRLRGPLIAPTKPLVDLGFGDPRSCFWLPKPPV